MSRLALTVFGGVLTAVFFGYAALRWEAAKQPVPVKADVPVGSPSVVEPSFVAAPVSPPPETVGWSVKTVLTPALTVGVTSPKAGILEALSIREGDQVTKGSTVARLRADNEAFAIRGADSKLRTSEIAVERQHVALENAKLDLQRYETLFRDGLVSKSEVDRARLACADKEKELERLKVELEFMREERRHAQSEFDRNEIAGPISGRVVRVYTTVGNAVGQGERLLEVADLDRFRVRFRVPIGQARLSLGQAVRLADEQGRVLGAPSVVFVSPTVFLPDNALEYEAELVPSRLGDLIPGMTVIVQAAK